MTKKDAVVPESTDEKFQAGTVPPGMPSLADQVAKMAMVSDGGPLPRPRTGLVCPCCRARRFRMERYCELAEDGTPVAVEEVFVCLNTHREFHRPQDAGPHADPDSLLVRA